MRFSGWSLREEIGVLVEQWYWLVLALLVGGGIGWGIAYVFPTDYETTAPLFVAFNADGIFTSPDDYKNAQFEVVDDLILSDAMLNSVLVSLQQNQGLWDDWTREDLRARLSLRWRNAGRWDLVARDQDPTQAERLAVLWRDVALQQIIAAISHAQTFYHLDQQLNAIIYAQETDAQKQAHLMAVEGALRDWLSRAGEGSDLERGRAELWAYALSLSMPDGFPEEGADRQAYVDWAESLLVVLDTEQALLAAQDLASRERMTTLTEDWLTEKEASRGLTAFLTVERREEGAETGVHTGAVREPGLLALVFGGVGVLGWLAFRLVMAARLGR